MAKININQATNEQLNYATAVAQGEEWMKANLGTDWRDNNFILSDYTPTTNQAQCGELIDKYHLTTKWIGGEWLAEYDGIQTEFEKSRLVAACKAYLWSVYPDGMIPYL